MVKAGIIGVGFIGAAHIEALRRLGNVEVAAVSNSDPERLEANRARYGVPKAYVDWREMVRDPGVDVIHICTPNHLHYEMTKAALLAGKHVVGEKPITTCRAEAEELVRLAGELGLVNAIDFNIRYYPLVRQLSQMVAKGELGEVFAVHGSYLQDWLFYGTDYNWRLETAMAGRSRAVADIGSHWMDTIEYVTGDRIAEVCADFATFRKVRMKPLRPVETYAGKIETPDAYESIPIGTEDYATVMFRLGGGGRGSFTVSQVSAGRKNRIQFEVDGSESSAAWESELPNQMWLGRRDAANGLLLKDPSLLYPESRELADYPGGHNEGHPDTFKMLFRDIYADITAEPGERRDPPTYPTFADGLREIALCDAICESDKKGGWVKVWA